jgi:hypothetical protein
MLPPSESAFEGSPEVDPEPVPAEEGVGVEPVVPCEVGVTAAEPEDVVGVAPVLVLVLVGCEVSVEPWEPVLDTVALWEVADDSAEEPVVEDEPSAFGLFAVEQAQINTLAIVNPRILQERT